MALTRNIPKEWLEGRKDVKEVIPKAIISFHKALDHKEKVEVLMFLCNELMPNVSLLDLEVAFLCNVFPKVAELVDKIFLEIDETLQLQGQSSTNKSEILHNLLMLLLKIMECIENCVKHIHETFSSINITQVHSLPVPVLLIVKSIFQHCKKSENAYGSLFEDVSQQLSNMFRKAFELQKDLMQLMNVKIENLTVNSSEEDLQNITAVCHSLLDICDITEQIDANITHGIWKSLMRLIMTNKERIKNHLEMERIVLQLCSTLEIKLQTYEKLFKNKEQTEQCQQSVSLFSKVSKVLKFLIKLLMNFVQSFQGFLIFSSFKCILNLIFSILSLTSGTKLLTIGEDFKESLTIVVEPLLQILVLNKNFADLLTRFDQEVDPKNQFSRCYILANVVILLPTLSDVMFTYWVNPVNYPEDEPRISVFEALFQSFDACYVEISLPVWLPGTMCNGKPQRFVSFYEYVVSRLTASITGIPSEYFHIVERILLTNVLDRSLTCSLMAIDVWCFVARWASADLCYCHVKLFLDWLSTISWKNNVAKARLRVLVRRLLPLMATEHQELLLKNYSPLLGANVEIWSLVPLHKMIEPVREQVSQSLVPLLNSVLRKWLNKDLSNAELDKYLYCLQNIVSHSTTLEYLRNDQKSELILLVVQLFDVFFDLFHQIPQSCWSSFIGILNSILPLMQPNDFTKVLRMIAKTVVLFKNDVQNINIARFMCECGKRTFPIEQSESTLISEIFQNLVSSGSWLIHTEAFLALKRFAEVTPYTPVLEQCIPDELKAHFQAFICSTPYSCFEYDDENILLLNILRQQAIKPQQKHSVIPASIQSTTNTVGDKDVISASTQSTSNTVQSVRDKQAEKRKPDDTAESEAKRKKVESEYNMTSDDEIKLTLSLEEISSQILVIQNIKTKYGLLPLEVYEKLKTVKESLDALVKLN